MIEMGKKKKNLPQVAFGHGHYHGSKNQAKTLLSVYYAPGAEFCLVLAPPGVWLVQNQQSQLVAETPEAIVPFP